MTPTEQAICQASLALFGTPEEQTATALAAASEGEPQPPPAERLIDSGLLTPEQVDRVLDAAFGQLASAASLGDPKAAPPPEVQSPRASVPGLQALLERLRKITSGELAIAAPVTVVERARPAVPGWGGGTVLPTPRPDPRKRLGGATGDSAIDCDSPPRAPDPISAGSKRPTAFDRSAPGQLSSTSVPDYACAEPFPEARDGATLHMAPAGASAGDSSQAGGPNSGLGNYELLGELARGGMGIVYKARQKGLGRIVCLKVLRQAELATDDDRRRFLREAEASARLHHPGIVPIHEVGEQGGQCFFSMDYVEGQELGHFVRDRAPPLRKVIQIMVRVCDAIHYAHMRGIIHRDLKPANVMVDLDEAPHVMDFGIAKRLDADGDSEHGPMTLEGEIMGTPHYMAPEQAQGHISEIDVRSDVYSLGVICYELVAGRRPFQDENILQLLHLVVHEDPAPLSVVRPDVDPDLETIVLKAMEKDKARRYQSALALKLELSRWLGGETILARRSTIVYRGRKWAARNRMSALTGAVGLAGVLLVGSLWISSKVGEALRRQREVARFVEQAQGETEEGKLEAAFNHYGRALIVDPQRAEARAGRVEVALRLAKLAIADHDPGGAKSTLRRVEYLGVRKDEIDAILEEAARERRRLVEVGVARQQRALAATRAALRALAALPTERALTREREQGFVFDLVRNASPETAQLLLSTVANAARSTRVRLVSARALGWMRERSAIPELARAMSPDAPVSLAYAAADALGWIGGEQAWTALLDARERRGAAFRARTQAALQRVAGDLGDAEGFSHKLDVLLLRADRLRQAGDFEEAVRAYDSALAKVPEAVEGYLGRALALVELGRLEEAEADLDRVVPAGGPSLSAALLDRAEVRRRRGNRRGAREDLDRLLRFDEQRADAYLARGRLSLEGGDPLEATRDFERAIGRRPDYASAFGSRAEAYLALGRAPEALFDVNLALRIEPEQAALLLVRCRVLLTQGELEAAQQDAASAARLRPNMEEAYLFEATAARRRGAVDVALETLQRGAEQTHSERLLLERARLLLASERPQEAKAAAELLVNAFRLPTNTRFEALTVRGIAELTLGDAQAAQRDLREVVEGRPAQASAHYNLACALAQGGDSEGAMSALRRALDLGHPRAASREDPDLAPLRGQPEFERLMKGEE